MNARGLRAVERALRRAPQNPDDRYETDARLVATALLRYWGDEAAAVLARALRIVVEAAGGGTILVPMRVRDAQSVAQGDPSLRACNAAAEVLSLVAETAEPVESGVSP